MKNKGGKSRTQHAPKSSGSAVISNCSIIPAPPKRLQTILYTLTSSSASLCSLLSYLSLAPAQTSSSCPCPSLSTDFCAFYMWLLHCKQGFPSCDMGDTPKLLLNIVQTAHLLLPHVLFTKLRWYALKWRWPRILLLGTKQGLELLPMPTAHSRHLLAVQSLFSQSLLLYSLPMLTPLWEKSSENTKITETVLEAVKTEKPDFLQMCIS